MQPEATMATTDIESSAAPAPMQGGESGPALVRPLRIRDFRFSGAGQRRHLTQVGTDCER